MFNNLSYKKKFAAVLLGFVLVLMACYKKTFKHMFESKNLLTQVEEKLSNTDNSYYSLNTLRGEIAGLDNLIGGQTKHPENVQHDIMNFVSNLSFNIDIVSVKDVHMYQSSEFLIYSNQIEIQGAYKDLVNTLYKIETEFKNSRVMSTQLYSKKNYRTNKKHLFLKIILQNYEKAK